ncbi:MULTISPECIES: flagellar export protein FliJ [unclassified Luteibacter]|uniref:flagellar export protein FliJ n=1 Tax=unclassified Luteibacter TaxID=2620188 RepID=UPI0008CFB4F4|nr:MULTISPECIES: flagellar export protein FliJ [unclassified Luteibacter]MDR6936609.1 flagellar FliJ protein [Luteibacter sp. 3190]SEV83906.1 flagellar FliJ protein [Luteibacter sp. 329MFSha]
MPSRADRLQPVVDLAAERAEKATLALATHQRAVAEAEHQLSELRRYRNEYAGMPDGIGVTALLNRQQFLQKIDMAIVQQMSEVERRGKALERARDDWATARGRAKALDSVTTKYRDQERKQQDRREQEQADERSQYRRAPRDDG